MPGGMPLCKGDAGPDTETACRLSIRNSEAGAASRLEYRHGLLHKAGQEGKRRARIDKHKRRAARKGYKSPMSRREQWAGTILLGGGFSASGGDARAEFRDGDSAADGRLEW